MPDHIKSLLSIFGLALPFFVFAKSSACAIAIASSDFARRRNLWFAITAIAFLAQNFWIYIIAAGALLLIGVKRETNKLGLYFFLLFAVPPIDAEIPGLGGIRYFFSIDYLRLLSLTILLPAALVLREDSQADGAKASIAEKFLAAFIVLNLLLQLNADSFTNTLRQGFIYLLDIVLPYYVASRALKNLGGFRDALMSFAVAGLALAIFSILEFSSHYLLYTPLKYSLGASNWDYGNYLIRDGILRAQGSTGHPIVLGYVMSVAIGAFMFLRRSVPIRVVWKAGLVLLIAGLIVPVSRGPWIGAAVAMLIFIGIGPRASAAISKTALVGVLALPILLFTPVGEKIVSFLPFVGTVEEDTIGFRHRLIDVSTDIILANPLFGSYDFMLYLEDLRAGGIIDIVNSYLNIALSSGLVGLALFLSFFWVILIGIFKGMRGLAKDGELHLLGRALVASLIGTLVTIVTTSSINVIPFVYWSLAGMGVAYIRLLARSSPSESGAMP
jgi:type III secretory pathway component EscS